MRLFATLLLVSGVQGAFVPFTVRPNSRLIHYGYLDDLQADLHRETDNPDSDELVSKDATNLAKDKQDRYGVGDWEGFVDFDEFDGGDGQMGVAGDGNKGLEKMGGGPQMANSKLMSAKNAWGTETGYAEQLQAERPGMDVARAQQLENWHNQQELRQSRVQHQGNTESFLNEATTEDENWRMLSSFGVERNQDFDLDSEFGPVVPGDQVEGVIELHSGLNVNAVFETSLTNEYMGFADFRAAFTPETSMEWTVEPREGSLSKDPVNFIVGYRPQNPGMTEGYLVIETEDFKKTWKVIGNTA